MTFLGAARRGPRTTWLDFGGDRDQNQDPGFLNPDTGSDSGSRYFSLSHAASINISVEDISRLEFEEVVQCCFIC